MAAVVCGLLLTHSVQREDQARLFAVGDSAAAITTQTDSGKPAEAEAPMADRQAPPAGRKQQLEQRELHRAPAPHL
jgi:NADH dehydrogenase FAD-containing subunit